MKGCEQTYKNKQVDNLSRFNLKIIISLLTYRYLRLKHNVQDKKTEKDLMIECKKKYLSDYPFVNVSLYIFLMRLS